MLRQLPAAGETEKREILESTLVDPVKGFLFRPDPTRLSVADISVDAVSHPHILRMRRARHCCISKNQPNTRNTRTRCVSKLQSPQILKQKVSKETTAAMVMSSYCGSATVAR
jgi:hypothetical protein